MKFLCSFIQEIQIKVTCLTFSLMKFEVCGVSELETLVLQNNCLLYACILKGYFMSHFVEPSTDDTTRYASSNILINLINFVFIIIPIGYLVYSCTKTLLNFVSLSFTQHAPYIIMNTHTYTENDFIHNYFPKTLYMSPLPNSTLY